MELDLVGVHSSIVAINTEIDGIGEVDISGKADISYVDMAVAGKADQAQVYTLAGEVGDLVAAVQSKAPINSPAFSGIPTAPTPGTSDASTKVATTAYVDARVTSLLGGAPSNYDTLKEIADQLTTDGSALSALTTAVGTKLAKNSNLSDLTNAAVARTNLGLGTASLVNAGTAVGTVPVLGAGGSLTLSGSFTTSEIKATAGGDLVFRRPDGTDVMRMQQGGTVRFPYGCNTDALFATVQGLKSSGNVPLYIYSDATLNPVVIGASSTTQTGNKLDVASPAVFRSTITATGPVTLSSNASVGGTFNVTGNTTLGGNLTFISAATVNFGNGVLSNIASISAGTITASSYSGDLITADDMVAINGITMGAGASIMMNAGAIDGCLGIGGTQNDPITISTGDGSIPVNFQQLTNFNGHAINLNDGSGTGGGDINLDGGDVNNAAKISISSTGQFSPLSFGTSLYYSGKKLALYEDTGGTDLYGFGVTAGSVDFYAAGVLAAQFTAYAGTQFKKFLHIADQAEPATPTGGGVLYVQGGALRYKGSSGTVTTLGPA